MKTSHKQKNSAPKSKLFGIIGDPISHTLSPAMHNAAFRKLKIPAVYQPFHVKPQGLKKFFKEARSLGLLGFNATIPHKEACIPFLKSISVEAKNIGAVNTVILKNGHWHGDNTDGKGYLKSLTSETKVKLSNKHITILGAGGAARAVLYALATQKPAHITIMNRTFEKTLALAQEFSNKFPKTHFEAFPLEKEAYTLSFPDTDLLINTTSLGLKGDSKENKLSLPLNLLPKKAIVSDLVYRPLKTPLLKKAERLKLKTHPGIGMLLYQGALAFEAWTKRKAPIATMKKALLDAL